MLLLARRSLKKLEMDEEYQGTGATGEDYSVEPAESQSPFRAPLDIGPLRTTPGNCVFGALKLNLNMAVEKEYYELLGVGEESSNAEINKAYYQKVDGSSSKNKSGVDFE